MNMTHDIVPISPLTKETLKRYKNDKEVKAITFDNNNQTYYFTDDSKIIKYTKEEEIGSCSG